MGEPTGLAQEQQHTLERLRLVPGLDGYYLAGGTAVAYHLEHRRSLDLDLFSVSGGLDLETVRARLVAELPDVKILSMSEWALKARVAAQAVHIVNYPFPPVRPLEPGPAGVLVASLLDLASMKLAAIARRGIRRDFWDLHAIAHAGTPLRAAADAYIARFGVAEPDLYHVLRSLTYFEDADKDPVFPRGLTPEAWGPIKAFFRREAPKLLR